ncbi:hypothetical protein ENBRE01_1775 [Enteropsectra breve]|nr:hypothetical protein ENBRE01_1775 [Enteropsectra breve]
MQIELRRILETLKREPKAQIFLAKVSKKIAPDYHNIIKKPMDLGTMEKKIAAYRSMEEFKADLDLI